MNGIGHEAAGGKTAKGDEQFPDFGNHARRQQAARADEGIAAPIQKPRVAGNEVRPAPRRTTKARAARASCRPKVSSSGKLRLRQGQRVGGRRAAKHVASNFECGRREVGGENDGDAFSVGQRQIEPAGAEGVAFRDLPAALFDRMGNVLAPFGLGMVSAGVAENAQVDGRAPA